MKVILKVCRLKKSNVKHNFQLVVYNNKNKQKKPKKLNKTINKQKAKKNVYLEYTSIQ